MNTIQEFKEKSYVHLKDFLDKDNCKQLTDELKKLVTQNKTINDPQCPLSEAVHGAVAFDSLLEQLLPHFEAASGLKLYPTYSYARLYNQQGEVLENHRDRSACEISATLTLGFDGDVWSIYMGANEDKSEAYKIDMAIGDAVMYRGCDIWHWREPYFEGQWQAQVFLHYVDANGPHAEWKYDKRESLGLSKTEQKQQVFDDCYLVLNGISDSFCNNIIKECLKDEHKKELPFIGFNDDLEKNINLNIRNTKRVSLSCNQGVGATLTSIGLNTNQMFWKFDITHSNQTEFLIYDINGKYETHTDTFHQHGSETRKITVLAMLNDDFEGGRFYIQNSHERFYPRQQKGDVIIFPSFMPHGVEPVTKGVRYSVVTWMVVPYFK